MCKCSVLWHVFSSGVRVKVGGMYTFDIYFQLELESRWGSVRIIHYYLMSEGICHYTRCWSQCCSDNTTFKMESQWSQRLWAKGCVIAARVGMSIWHVFLGGVEGVGMTADLEFWGILMRLHTIPHLKSLWEVQCCAHLEEKGDNSLSLKVL